MCVLSQEVCILAVLLVSGIGFSEGWQIIVTLDQLKELQCSVRGQCDRVLYIKPLMYPQIGTPFSIIFCSNVHQLWKSIPQ